MVRHLFVLLLFLVCAVYIADSYPDIKLDELRRWAGEQGKLERVERGAGGRGRGGRRGGGRGGGGGRRGGGNRRRGGQGGRANQQAQDSSDSSDSDGNDEGTQSSRGRNRARPRQRQRQRSGPPPRWRNRPRQGRPGCDDKDKETAQGQQGQEPQPETTTTTTTPTTTPTTTTTTPDPLDAKPVDPADTDGDLDPAGPNDTVDTGDGIVLNTGGSTGVKEGCIVEAGVIVLHDSEKIDCKQMTIVNNQVSFPTFAHTQCGMYCACGSNGKVTLKTCPGSQAWDAAKKQCTSEAYADCASYAKPPGK